MRPSPVSASPVAALSSGLRLAAIDIGTNSIHMVIARATGGATFELVDREREVVQIGRGSFRTGRLQTQAITRTAEALARFADLARRREVDRILCTATAAVREARNGGEFLRAAREVARLNPRVIPAEEEGRLIYLAVRSALGLDEQPALILDIGGGSVQLVVGDRERLLHCASVPLGALRLTETMLDSDPPSADDLQRLERHIRRTAADALEAVKGFAPARVYGSSGSIHALAELAHREETGAPIAQINGHVLTIEALERVRRRLQKLSLAEREKLQGLDAQRAGIIVPGALVLAHVLEAMDAEAIVLSDFGVREGLVTDYLARHLGEIQALGAVEDVKLRSVLQLLQKFQPEDRQQRHARHVTTLALALYDGLKSRHGLPDEARRLLQYAGLLHDIGAVVGYDDHAAHSDYLIRNGNLRGFSEPEVELIALVARYHGKGRPRRKFDPRVAALGKSDRRTLRWLAAMLRLAESLDRSHYQLVGALRVVIRRQRASVLVTARPGARLELWAARRRVDLLERLLDRSVRIASDPTAPAVPARPARRASQGSSPAAAASAEPATNGAARVQPAPGGATRPAAES